jgi:hypothetical protein
MSSDNFCSNKETFEKYRQFFETKNTTLDKNYRNVLNELRQNQQKNSKITDMHQFCSTPNSVELKKNSFANKAQEEPKVASSPNKLPNSSNVGSTDANSLELKLGIATFLDKIIKDGINKLDQCPQKTNKSTNPFNHLIRPNLNDFGRFKNPYLPFPSMDNNLQKQNILKNYTNLFNNNSNNNLLQKNMMSQLYQNYPRYPQLMPCQMNPLQMSHLPPLQKSAAPRFGYGNGRKPCMQPSFCHNHNPYQHSYHQHQCPNHQRALLGY